MHAGHTKWVRRRQVTFAVTIETAIDAVLKKLVSVNVSMAVVESLRNVAAKLPDSVDRNSRVLLTLYDSHVRLAILDVAHLLDKDPQSVSVFRIIRMGTGNPRCMAFFNESSGPAGSQERFRQIREYFSEWKRRFDAVPIARDVRRQRDWVLAHTDARSVAQPEMVPGISITDVNDFANLVYEFLNKTRVMVLNQEYLSTDLVRHDMQGQVNQLVATDAAFVRAVTTEALRYQELMDDFDSTVKLLCT